MKKKDPLIYEPKLDIYLYNDKYKDNEDGLKIKRILRFFPKTDWDWDEFIKLCLAYDKFTYWWLADISLYYSELSKILNKGEYARFSLVNMKTQAYKKPFPCAIIGLKDFKKIYILCKKYNAWGFPVFLKIFDGSIQSLSGEGEWDLGYQGLIKKLNIKKSKRTITIH